jgi:hypothetical protein
MVFSGLHLASFASISAILSRVWARLREIFMKPWECIQPAGTRVHQLNPKVIYGVGALYSSLDTKLISSGGPWRAFFTFWNSLFSLGPGVEENIRNQEKTF